MDVKEDVRLRVIKKQLSIRNSECSVQPQFSTRGGGRRRKSPFLEILIFVSMSAMGVLGQGHVRGPEEGGFKNSSEFHCKLTILK